VVWLVVHIHEFNPLAHYTDAVWAAVVAGVRKLEAIEPHKLKLAAVIAR